MKRIWMISILAIVLAGLLVGAKKKTAEDDSEKPEHPDTTEIEGKAAPEFTLPHLGDKELTTSLSEEKGNVVAIVWWSSYCPNCKKFLPGALQEWNQDKKLADRGLKIIAIDRKKDRD